MKIETVIAAILKEYSRASATNGSFHSVHEGYAILLEEIEELWDEIRLKAALRNPSNVAHEAIQIGAMAMRFLYDLCREGDEK